MRTVRIEKFELLGKLNTNRAKHRELFEKAQIGYRQAVIKELDRMLEDARQNRSIRLYVGLEAPEDHTKDYDAVIAMVEMSVDPNIELQQQEFRQYVLDEWTWSGHAQFKNASYASGQTVPISDHPFANRMFDNS